MIEDEWDGPFKQERIAADKALANGDDEIDYRGMTFFVNDDERGWTYQIGHVIYSSLEEVFEAIDKEIG